MDEKNIDLRCPYSGFKRCYKGQCAAWRKYHDPIVKGYYMYTCAIAFNGGVPAILPLPEPPKEADDAE